MLIGLFSIIVFIAAVVVSVGWGLSSHLPKEITRQFESLPYYEDGKFFNQERQAAFELGWNSIERQFAGTEQRIPPAPLPVVPIDPVRFEAPASKPLLLNWLGHSSVLVEFDGYRILMDPVFSKRASPFSFIGPGRFHPPVVALAQLKNIDAVVISHNHYDHFDEPTIRHLAKQGTQIFVPLGVSERLKSWGIPSAQIHSLEWWQEVSVGDLRIIATPTRHYSGRGLFDYKATHWASWSLVGTSQRVFYSGDTGYSKLFATVGEKLGPFDLSIIKVGSYGPGQSWLDIHMLPEDSIRTHLDVKGKRMLPVHWGTFNLGYHAWDEPIKRAIAGATANNVELVIPTIGESVHVASGHNNHPWWESVR